MGFDSRLAEGLAGESVIARYLRARGWNMLPVYEKIVDTGKGPQVFTPTTPLVAPDMLAFDKDGAYWIEAKHKNAFTLHRKTDRWVTGIDLRHYGEYQQVADVSPWPVWLFFLQRGGQAKDSPKESPSGLFGGTLPYLKRNENHRSDRWGTSGMVYWAHDKLKLVAPLAEVLALSA